MKIATRIWIAAFLLTTLTFAAASLSGVTESGLWPLSALGRMGLWPIPIIYGAFFLGMLIIGIASAVASHMTAKEYVAKYADEAYRFFIDRPALFKISFPVEDSPIAGQAPSVVCFRFQVPMLQNRLVLVRPISRECAVALKGFVFEMNSKENPLPPQEAFARRLQERIDEEQMLNKPIVFPPRECSYEERIRYYSLADLDDIRRSTDKEKFSDRYQLVVKEIDKRMKA